MKKRSWKRHIIAAMRAAGTYDERGAFDLPIDCMAETMELRDEAMKQFAEEGGRVSLERKNRAKEPNMYRNPLIGVIKDLNATALQYAGALGITPQALKNMNRNALQKKHSALAGLLDDLTDDTAADMDPPKLRS